MRQLLKYMVFACVICTICTLIVVLMCSCDDSQINIQYATAANIYGDGRSISLPNVYLIIVIMSQPNDTTTRTIIRNTWLKLSSKGANVYRHKFAIGIHKLSNELIELLKEENNLNNDLLLLNNIEDHYSSLSKKTLQSIDSICEMFNFKFLLKVDSDSFVRVGAFLKALKDIEDPLLYWGFLDGRAKPYRKGKWAEHDWILCDRYLPYQLGGGYVLSYKLAQYISINKALLKLYRNEDVSVGAWLSGLNVKYVHDPRFDTEFRSRGCNNQYIITHKQSPQQLLELYSSLVNSGRLCVKEYRNRASYIYDWSVLPSLCCIRTNNSNIP